MAFQPLGQKEATFAAGWGRGLAPEASESGFVAWEVPVPGGSAPFLAANQAEPEAVPSVRRGVPPASAAPPRTEDRPEIAGPAVAANDAPPEAPRQEPPPPPAPRIDELLAPLRAQVEAERDRARAVLEDVATLRERIVAASRRDMLDAVWLIVSRVLSGEVRTDRGLVERIVDAVADELAREETVVLRVHPRDHAWLAPRQGELADRIGARRLLVEPDRAMEAGGCVIDASFGRIDAAVSTQLDAFRGELDRYLRAEGSGRGGRDG